MLRTVPGTDSSTIPLYCLQSLGSPFFGDLMMRPSFQSSRSFSSSCAVSKKLWRLSVGVCRSAVKASAGMLPGPDASHFQLLNSLPDLRSSGLFDADWRGCFWR